MDNDIRKYIVGKKTCMMPTASHAVDFFGPPPAGIMIYLVPRYMYMLCISSTSCVGFLHGRYEAL